MSGPSPFLEKDNSTVIDCRQCGSPVPPGRAGKLYCSTRCCERWRYLNKVKPAKHGDRLCARCGSSFAGSTGQRKYCSPGCFDEAAREREAGTQRSVRTYGEANCQTCSREFTRRISRQLHCSKTCAMAASELRRQADGRRKAQKEVKRRPEYGTLCVGCAKPLVRFRTDVPRCKSCSSIRKMADARRVRVLAKAEAAALGTTGAFLFASGACLKCGSWFTHFQTAFASTCYCSRSCKGKMAARGAVRRRKIGKLARARVHNQCGWTCQICGDPVDTNAEVGDPGYPVIDHRIPLGAGGLDVESNWQTAHWYCNHVKSDQVGFEFWTPAEEAA